MINEAAVNDVLVKLDRLADGLALGAREIGGDPKRGLTDRDKYIGLDASALSFETAARLLRAALS